MVGTNGLEPIQELDFFNPGRWITPLINITLIWEKGQFLSLIVSMVRTLGFMCNSDHSIILCEFPLISLCSNWALAPELIVIFFRKVRLIWMVYPFHF